VEGESYLQIVVREFDRLKKLSEGALAQLDDSEFFEQSSDAENSVALVVKHLAGNMRSRWRDFLTSDGEKPERDRDSEFEIAASDTRESLERLWEEGWKCLFEALAPLADGDLTQSVLIRGEPHSVLQAINRQLAHYAYHTGQIVFAAKSLRGDGWRTLSVPKGGSSAFNAGPSPYLGAPDAGRSGRTRPSRR
jgi:hypothetical protein